MPTVDEILFGLREIVNTWKAVSIFWHLYFGAVVVALAMGVRPSRRVAGVMLTLPLLSVSTIAWRSSNPFNGAVFAVIGVAFLVAGVRLRSSVKIAPAFPLLPGVLLFVFGWIYPHFLDTSTYISYLYAAPTGLIPCPTLSIVIGSVLVMDGLGSRAVCTLLGVAGLFYGIIGVVQLHVAVDGVLLFGAVAALICAFATRRNASEKNGSWHGHAR